MNLEGIITNSQLLQRSGQNSLTTEDISKAKPKLQGMQEEGETHRQSGEEISKDRAMELVDGLNEFMEPMNTSIKFEFHDKLDRYYVSVIDSNTDEVIKEIPPKKMLDVYAAMAEFMGFIVDERI
ncbi:flagellar biosynthesis protein FlaG [Halalkalibacillus sediminis]|uniref:Flagellar biosynthesis protein FlaG n=1 Tax=Halalkalibacillus sediminis TaxID=2018042 RepID=A0A2I0QV64_9BACI|nr:flagellar protein FlaG [Halalkalibacillus sediminis]PKR77990.1 flagellar biosynthesis protein FlaG [Halalkalibacillus sediminis]